jgi:rhodanese-related sulfurtransferase
MPHAPTISPAEALRKMQSEGFVYVDVRSEDEYAAGHPDGARNIPFMEAFVDNVSNAFAKDAKLILGCQKGQRSAMAAELLLAAGFTNVLNQHAGWDGARGAFGELIEAGWLRAELPQATGK